MASKPVHLTTQGTEEVAFTQQYAKIPSAGLVVSVRQRTTHAGRSVLLAPDEIRQLRDDLTAWLSMLDGDAS